MTIQQRLTDAAPQPMRMPMEPQKREWTFRPQSRRVVESAGSLVGRYAVRRRVADVVLGLARLVAYATGWRGRHRRAMPDTGGPRESQAARGRHAATAVTLTGRVIVSNMGSRWIIFYPDGTVDPDNDAGYQWYVIGDGWQDADGGFHQGDEYPPCLVGSGGVETNPRRVELTTIDGDNGCAADARRAARRASMPDRTLRTCRCQRY